MILRMSARFSVVLSLAGALEYTGNFNDIM